MINRRPQFLKVIFLLATFSQVESQQTEARPADSSPEDVQTRRDEGLAVGGLSRPDNNEDATAEFDLAAGSGEARVRSTSPDIGEQRTTGRSHSHGAGTGGQVNSHVSGASGHGHSHGPSAGHASAGHGHSHGSGAGGHGHSHGSGAGGHGHSHGSGAGRGRGHRSGDGGHGHSHGSSTGGHGHSHGVEAGAHGHNHASVAGGHGHSHGVEAGAHGHSHASVAGHGHSVGSGAGAHGHSHGNAIDDSFDINIFGRAKLWGLAISSSLAVSCASLVCLTLLPLVGGLRGDGASYKPPEALVKALSAFAVGAMLGFFPPLTPHLHIFHHRTCFERPAFPPLPQVEESRIYMLRTLHLLRARTDPWRARARRDGDGLRERGLEDLSQESDGLGDAFLHQLPHAFQAGPGHAHSHGADHSWMDGIKEQSVGLSVMFGILVFFLVEKLVRHHSPRPGEHRAGGGHGHSHGHIHLRGPARHEPADPPREDACATLATGSNFATPTTSIKSEGTMRRRSQRLQAKLGSAQPTCTGEVSSGPVSDAEQEVTSSELCGDAFQPAAPDMQLHTAGWLNLVADAVHNFTDGMAIGAAYVSGGPLRGWSKTVFMLAHELPQEVGDYGILLGAGFKPLEALAFNFLSALVALAGTVLALYLGGDGGGSSMVEGFTAGGFIYIAAAGVIPEMQQEGLGSTLGQVLSMTAGTAVCVLIHASGGCTG
ncbi:hypothetical protein CYMTET_23991 [Cymbomonas tetramitiformis]|uniref:Uncharacterized protein n=1 Tax=Cymbomonas tetramitiformis TaxID=36881 RepID=A0AAE0FXL4_9CHLO|nr:hypothetical protein CYMTET_23991 [Cymbomonas tetramitiformis]